MTATAPSAPPLNLEFERAQPLEEVYAGDLAGDGTPYLVLSRRERDGSLGVRILALRDSRWAADVAKGGLNGSELRISGNVFVVATQRPSGAGVDQLFVYRDAENRYVDYFEVLESPEQGASALAAGVSDAGISSAEEAALHITAFNEGTLDPWDAPNQPWDGSRGYRYGQTSTNFDGGLLSFGINQWNFWSGTLPELLRRFAQMNDTSFWHAFSAISEDDRAEFSGQVLNPSSTVQSAYLWGVGKTPGGVWKKADGTPCSGFDAGAGCRWIGGNMLSVWREAFGELGLISEFQAEERANAYVNYLLPTQGQYGAYGVLDNLTGRSSTRWPLRAYLALEDNGNQYGLRYVLNDIDHCSLSSWVQGNSACDRMAEEAAQPEPPPPHGYDAARTDQENIEHLVIFLEPVAYRNRRSAIAHGDGTVPVRGVRPQWDTYLTGYGVPTELAPMFRGIPYASSDGPAETLQVALGVGRPLGPPPLAADLTATASGSAAGTINYSFWWDCLYLGASVAEAISQCGDPHASSFGAKFDGLSEMTKTVSHTYTTPGNYTAKVIAERGNAPWATDSKQITVTGGASCQSSISLNQPVQGNLTADCTSTHRAGRYAKYYVFSVSQTTNVQIDVISSQFDAYLYLLSGSGASGEALVSNDDGGGGHNSRIVTSLNAGTYTIEATSYDRDATGAFTLTLGATGGGSACQSSISLGQGVSGNLMNDCPSVHRGGSYARYYTFSLSEPTSAEVDLGSSDFDTFLYLLSGTGSDGGVLASDDDGGGGTNSRIIQVLPAGNYTIEVTSYRSGSTGSFSLQLAVAAGGDSCQSTLNFGQTAQGTLTSACPSVHRAGYAEYFVFSLSQATTVQIDLSSSTFDAYVYLLNGSGSTGSVVGSDDDSGGNRNSRLIELLGPGTYTIEATSYWPGATGAFSLQLAIAGSGSGCTSNISLNQTVQGSLTNDCPAVQGWGSYAKYYVFTIGQATSIQIDLNSTAFDAYLYLLSGAGAAGQVIASNDDGGGNLNARITTTLSPGTYTIEATSFWWASTGAFTLTFTGGGSGSAGIHGRVTYQGSPVASVDLSLYLFDGNNWSEVATTTTQGDGIYWFTGVAGLSPGQKYSVRFQNTQFGNSHYLWAWWSFGISSYNAGAAVQGGDFDIATIALVSPTNGASVSLLQSFAWQPRSATPTDSYYFELFDPTNTSTHAEFGPLGYVSDYVLSALPPGFSLGTSYGWYVDVVAPDGGAGISFYYSGIAFQAQ